MIKVEGKNVSIWAHKKELYTELLALALAFRDCLDDETLAPFVRIITAPAEVLQQAIQKSGVSSTKIDVSEILKYIEGDGAP